jgi:hypothetical protein
MWTMPVVPHSELIMGRFAREDVLEVLAKYGVASARRADDTDESEEIILLSESAYKKVDVNVLTRDLMEVLPHVKVWVAPDNSRWPSEPI